MSQSRTVLHEILERGHFSPTTSAKYVRVIDEWVTFAGTDPSGWTRDRAQAFYDSLLTRMQEDSANVRFASLRYVSKWFALKQSDPNRDFAVVQLKATRNAEPDEARHALAPDDAIALIATCIEARTPIERRDRTILILGFETGMRRKSLAGATLEGYKSKGTYPTMLVPIKGPGGEAWFEVPLSDIAQLVVSDWVTWLRRQGVSKGSMFPRFKRTTRILGGRSPSREIAYQVQLGAGMSDTAIYEVVTKRSREAGIKHVHPHLLRHSFITWRHQAGLDGPQIASITGHKVKSAQWGAVAGYLDPQALAATARNSTPDWLASFIRSRI